PEATKLLPKATISYINRTVNKTVEGILQGNNERTNWDRRKETRADKVLIRTEENPKWKARKKRLRIL
ncbi:MAG TPA: hypothetical protein PK637_18750, partial [Flavobacteriales bacterium]|nr:hypothetical protein [Flavobacteriales bacterium]